MRRGIRWSVVAEGAVGGFVVVMMIASILTFVTFLILNGWWWPVGIAVVLIISIAIGIKYEWDTRP